VAAQATDINTMTALQPQLTAKLEEGTDLADQLGIGGDFEGWFQAQIDSFKEESDKYFEDADKYNKNAARIYAANNR